MGGISFIFVVAMVAVYDGVLATEDRIIGGRPAYQGEVPYQVSLRRSYNDAHFCGGILVTPIHVLTAAHCAYYIWGGVLPPFVVSAVFGQLRLPITSNSVYRNASLITIHPDFIRKAMVNDLAIIELDEEVPVDVNPLISTVPLGNKSMSSGTCFVSGWGVEQYGSKIISDILLLAEVDIVNFDKCRQLYSENVTLYDGMLCAGHINGTTDACQGDSGGPLVCDGVLMGVVSTGSGCGTAEYPGIYADVPYYYDWIMSVISSSTMEGSVVKTLANTEEHNFTFLSNKGVVMNFSNGVEINFAVMVAMLILSFFIFC